MTKKKTTQDHTSLMAQPTILSSSNFTVTLKITDKTSPLPHPPSLLDSGIGFLNHMLDQLQSHGQLIISCEVKGPLHSDESWAETEAAKTVSGSEVPLQTKILRENINAFVTTSPSAKKQKLNSQSPSNSSSNQAELLSLVGRAVGVQLKGLLSSLEFSPTTFTCPLDESISTVTFHPPTSSSSACLQSYSLDPFANRSRLGYLQLVPMKQFFSSLCDGLGLSLSIDSVRGKNGHHILESTFKAIARGFRKVLDLLNPAAEVSTPPAIRSAKAERTTKETTISMELALGSNPVTSSLSVPSMLPAFRTLLSAFFSSWPSLSSTLIVTSADLWIDDHHAVEDIGITLGQVVRES
jgi:imidazoleglycerol phosphate dehydratase HisB